MIWRRDERGEQQAAPEEPPKQEREQPRQDRHEGRRRMAEDREVTILGQGASLEGNIVSAGSLRIDGQIKGQINSEGDVTLSERSQVEAVTSRNGCLRRAQRRMRLSARCSST